MLRNKRKRRLALSCALLLFAGLLSGCAGQSEDDGASGAETSPALDAGTVAASTYDNVKDEDLDASWDEAGSTLVTLAGDNITAAGGGAAADGSALTITEAGTYVLTGALSDGQIVVEAPDTALVRIVLNGAALHCEDSAPINCVTADKLVVILAGGTENFVSDGDSYTFPDSETDEPDAAIFSKADLTINGSGSLTVTAGYNNGIGTKDDLILVSGKIEVTAANNAVRGRDSVTVLEAALILNAGNDGIQSNNDSAADKGWIALYGGSYTITAAHDGIQAETALAIYDGEFDITAGGGSANAPERAEEQMGGNWGGMNGDRGNMVFPEDGAMPERIPGAMPEGMPENMPEGMPENMPEDRGAARTAPPAESEAAVNESEAAGENTGGENADADTGSDSYKALKAGGSLTVEGGFFTIDSADDALHANANVTVSGGTFTIATGDDAVHADADLFIEDKAVMDITTCYEGLEGSNVTVNGGEISIYASDDGINAAGGSSNGTGGGGLFGLDLFSGGGDYTITINGGTIRINAGFDGLDSNGDILITGGEVTIAAAGTQAAGGDGAIDCDGSFTINGGTVAAAGGAAFVIMGAGGASINAEGAQPVLNFQFTEAQAAGTAVELKDGDGRTLVSYIAEKEFKTIALSSPEMQDGQSYTVYANGEEVYTAALSGSLTSLSDTGESVDTAFGGMGGRGGMDWGGQ